MKHNALAILPRELERFSTTPREGLRFGVPEVDALLPLGVPRGQITALDAPLGSGGTALLLALAQATLAADEGVALVDAQRTLAPQAAAHLAASGTFWVIRPRGRGRSPCGFSASRATRTPRWSSGKVGTAARTHRRTGTTQCPTVRLCG